MSWAIGYDSKWQRDIGYGVPALCDHPDCDEKIDRGLSHVCGGAPYGGDCGCGLYFCSAHLAYFACDEDNEDGMPPLCIQCGHDLDPFTPKSDSQEWINWKMTDESWAEWRMENPEWVKAHTIKTEKE